MSVGFYAGTVTALGAGVIGHLTYMNYEDAGNRGIFVTVILAVFSVYYFYCGFMIRKKERAKKPKLKISVLQRMLLFCFYIFHWGGVLALFFFMFVFGAGHIETVAGLAFGSGAAVIGLGGWYWKRRLTLGLCAEASKLKLRTT